MSILVNGNRIILQNEFLRRIIDIEDGICTKSYHIRTGGELQGDTWCPTFSFIHDSPYEAALTVDGVTYEASPAMREASGNLWDRPSSFVVKNTLIGKSQWGETLDIVMNSRDESMPQVELTLHYDVADKLPCLKKSVTVKNIDQKPLTLEKVTVDMIHLSKGVALDIFTNYTQSEKVEFKDKYYFGWSRIEFPGTLDLILLPGESMDSFDLYEAVTALDRQERSVILHRLYKEIAPWIMNLNLSLNVSNCKTTAELYKTADIVAENGLELICLFVGQLFTNTGDYIPKPDLFPEGYSDVKRFIQYCHDKGLKVTPYCSTTIAARDTKVCQEHPDWQCLGPDGLRYEPGGYGNMCYHSPWGDYIREKLLYLLDEVGFDGLSLDGPVHGLVCEETNHAHRTPASVDYMNWVWEKNFYKEVTSRGKLAFAPERWNAIFLGISKTPGGYREEDHNEYGGFPLVSMTRAYVSNARYDNPPCCVWSAFYMDKYHGHSIEADDEHPASYEHGLAALLGYGIDSTISTMTPYVGENTKAIYWKWMNVYRTYRETLMGDFIHIDQPTGYRPDAVMHTRAGAQTPALLVVFNPCEESKNVQYTLPLRYAEMEPESDIVFDEKIVHLDSISNASVYISLKPYEVKAFPIRSYIPE